MSEPTKCAVTIESSHGGEALQSAFLRLSDDDPAIDEWTTVDAVAVARCAFRFGIHPLDLVIACLRDYLPSQDLTHYDPFIILAKAYLTWSGPDNLMFEEAVKIYLNGKELKPSTSWPKPDE